MGEPPEQSDAITTLHDFRGLSGQIAGGIVRK